MHGQSLLDTTNATELVFGNQPGGNGTLLLDGPHKGILGSATLVLGNQGTGTLELANGRSFDLTGQPIQLGVHATSAGVIAIDTGGASSSGARIPAGMPRGATSENQLA